MVMLPADHHVARPEAMREALAAGAQLAFEGAVVTIGIRPDRPETGYGYLKVGAKLKALGRGKKAFHPARVERFVEKPDVVTAARYLAEGGYLWNSGIFVFRADVILEEIRRAMPVLGEQLAVIEQSLGTPSYAADAGAGLPGRALHLHRLRRHGEEPAHRGGPGRLRLERRGQLRGPPRGARPATTSATCCRATPWSSTGTTTWCSATAGRPVAVVGVDGRGGGGRRRRGAGGAARSGPRTCARRSRS